jgi:hypothetical protein
MKPDTPTADGNSHSLEIFLDPLLISFLSFCLCRALRAFPFFAAVCSEWILTQFRNLTYITVTTLQLLETGKL